MRAISILLLFAIIVQIATPISASAHHSISAEFNGARRMTLSGPVTKVAWANPHSFFYIDVKDAKSGAVVSWACELGSPNMLATLGWTHSTLKVGMNVTLTGIPARDGTHKVIARNIVVNGTPVIAWPSEQH
jgi:hypothetical protein